MARSRPKVYAHRRHKKVLKFTKGQYGSRSKLFKRANEAMLKSLAYAYRDRRNRKRDFRRLWITRINAAARLNGLKYSHLIYGLKRPMYRWTAKCWPTSPQATQMDSAHWLNWQKAT